MTQRNIQVAVSHVDVQIISKHEATMIRQNNICILLYALEACETCHLRMSMALA